MLLSGRAHAQLEPAPEPNPAAPSAAAAGGPDRLTLPKGRLVLNAFLGINLTSDVVGKPISLSPDLWYGYNDRITVGLVHSTVALTGFVGNPLQSLCLTGSDSGCSDIYPDVGFEGRYQLLSQLGGFSWAAAGGLDILRTSDPLQLAIKLGAVGRRQEGPLAIEVEPSLRIGLTNRTASTMMGVPLLVQPNRDVLLLPVTGLYPVSPEVTVSAQLGLILPFEDAGDFYAVPLSLAGHYRVDESVTAVLALSFPLLIAGSGGATTKLLTGLDARSLTLGGTYAF